METEVHRKRILGILELFMADNQKAYEMRSDGSYRRRKFNGKSKISAQDELVRQARDNAADATPAAWQVVPLNKILEQR